MLLELVFTLMVAICRQVSAEGAYLKRAETNGGKEHTNVCLELL